MKEKMMKGMKMNKALLPLLLCCFIFPASGKDAGWQWYNEKINPKEK
ncbi:type-F conjugative transfer system pilin assembly protein TraF, partial [Escherichia coli]